MIIMKDGKIIAKDGKILTNVVMMTPEIAEKIEQLIIDAENNTVEIERIKDGTTLVGEVKGITVNDEKVEPNEEGIVNIEIPEYLNATKLSYNANSGVLTLLNKNDKVLSYVDLPLELFIKSGSYDTLNNNIVLKLSNNEEIKIPVSGLVDIYLGDEETIHLNAGTNTFSLADIVLEKIDNKQEKLTPGDLIEITENGVISCKASVIDFNRFEFATGGDINDDVYDISEYVRNYNELIILVKGQNVVIAIVGERIMEVSSSENKYQKIVINKLGADGSGVVYLDISSENNFAYVEYDYEDVYIDGADEIKIYRR